LRTVSTGSSQGGHRGQGRRYDQGKLKLSFSSALPEIALPLFSKTEHAALVLPRPLSRLSPRWPLFPALANADAIVFPSHPSFLPLSQVDCNGELGNGEAYLGSYWSVGFYSSESCCLSLFSVHLRLTSLDLVPQLHLPLRWRGQGHRVQRDRRQCLPQQPARTGLGSAGDGEGHGRKAITGSER
jgi:hypothetical protein